MKLIQPSLIKLKEYCVRKKKLRERLLLIVKIILSLFAIIYVLRRVSIGDITDLLDTANYLYLAFALLLFVGSKLISAIRALLILNQYSVPLSGWENLKLYWTGMFFNLFLPGGIGGDIYKTVVINKIHNNGLKLSAGVVLMDRIAGVAALTVLALIFIPLTNIYHHVGWICLIGISVTVFGFTSLVLIFLPRLKEIVGIVLLWSFVVQILQLLSVICIMKAIAIQADYLEYLLIFLISSVAAMLPVSVGGVGIRELVFFSISDYLFLDQKVAVTISFTFYLITVLASSLGIITALESRRNEKLETEKLI
jgi:uncharacterized membrane protein YbhN (UPF0104 family)